MKNILLFRRLALSVFILMVVLSGIKALAASEVSQPVRTITDMSGRTTIIPVFPERIACFFGPSYEKVFLLGAADRVAIMGLKQLPWAHHLNPVLKNVPVVTSRTSPNIEKMIALKIDLVFYFHWPSQTAVMEAAGIPVVCPYSAMNKPETVEAFIEKYKRELLFYGNVLGPKSKAIAREYCDYFDEKAKKITAVTSAIKKENRPSVFYICGWDKLSTQGKYSLTFWLLYMAGGISVSGDIPKNFVNATKEQLIKWNPDIIMMGNLAKADPVTNEPGFRTISAVKNGRVYICPQGAFSGGHGSSESILLLMFLAKTFHPNLFADIDILQEIKYFYNKFYHYPLTDEGADRILNHLPPS